MNVCSPTLPKRRWIGVVLSLIVPGFGLVRAGLPYRGLAWCAGLQFAALFTGLTLALDMIPFWLATFFLIAVFGVQIWMLCDSFRPGRMTVPLWLLFAGMIAVVLWVPSPASLVARAFKIPSGAMEPTLLGPRPGAVPDHVIADRLSYHLGVPRRGDLIVFDAAKIPRIAPYDNGGREVFYIKRIVGLPGERIRISGGKAFANDRLLGESDGLPPIAYTESRGVPSSAKHDGQDFVVGPHEYFVLGDNSPNSHDSRYWGCVPASAVYGKVTAIYYPIDRAGRIFAK